MEETYEILHAPLKPEDIKQRVGWRDRQGNDVMVSYIEWTTAAEILDAAYESWSYSIQNVEVHDTVIVCTARIYLGDIYRDGIGTGDLRDGEMGFKGAESDALKRAATKFGVGRELYSKEHAPAAQPTGNQGHGGSGSGGGSVPATEPQKNLIRKLLKELDINIIDALAGTYPDSTPIEPTTMTKTHASDVITHLNKLKAEANEMNQSVW